MKPGTPFVMAHHRIDVDAKSRADWAWRFAAFGASDGVTAPAAPARASIFDQSPILSPDQEEAQLRDAGFTDVTLFYAAFSFRCWVAYA